MKETGRQQEEKREEHYIEDRDKRRETEVKETLLCT